MRFCFLCRRHTERRLCDVCIIRRAFAEKKP
jgi:hypothetical protein